MTPPKVSPNTADVAQGATTSAVSSCPETTAVQDGTPATLLVLGKRSEFLAAARARRQGMGAMMVQARRRDPGERVPAGVIRVGFTCSKKVGNAVARNRAKRRLREVARAILPGLGQPGWDYVLIGRKDDTANRPFELLTQDLVRALERLHAERRKPDPQDGSRDKAQA